MTIVKWVVFSDDADSFHEKNHLSENYFNMRRGKFLYFPKKSERSAKVKTLTNDIEAAIMD